MVMTKKDYEAFAALNRQMFDLDEMLNPYWFIGQVRIFSKDNPRFDAKRFLIASGIADIYADKLSKEALNNG